MVKRSLVCASLALLAASAAQPASADTKFFEPYGNIFGARTILGSPADARPKDALQTQESRREEPTRRIAVSPFFNTEDLGNVGDTTYFGGTLAYASTANPEHPWQLYASIFNLNVDIDRPFGFDDDFFGFDIVGKYVLWTPAEPNLPVVSVVFRYMDVEDIGNRWDAALAADQRLSDEFYLTANLGWADADPDGAGGGESDFIPGFGLSWHPRSYRPLSLHFDYVVDNDVDGEDDWSISAIHTFGDTFAARVGGGKHSRFFGNLVAKWD